MKKELRFQNTDFYEYTNVNPKDKYGGDCVIRAIALATGQSWEQTIRELTEVGIKKGFVLIDWHVYEKYLETHGFIRCKEPRDVNNRKMTVKEWMIEEQITKGTFVIVAGTHHLSCIVDGKVRDIWDASKVTMHKYWFKVGSNK